MHVKLADFGFATMGDGWGASLRAAYSGATPDFMSPELAALSSLRRRDLAAYNERKRQKMFSVPMHDGWAWAVTSLAVFTCNPKLNRAAHSLDALNEKTATLPTREWGSSEIDQWVLGLPIAGVSSAMRGAITKTLRDLDLQDGTSLLSLTPHKTEQTTELRTALMRIKPKGIAGTALQVGLVAGDGQ